MSNIEQEKNVNETVSEAVDETVATVTEEAEAVTEGEQQSSDEKQQSPGEAVQAALKEQEDKYLRLAAEYDNFRKRTQREKESIWSSAKADVILAFLPVYDNLERALKQETEDEAYAKGVEMTMTQMKTVLEKLGVEEIPALGQTFDPALHNAVMHIDDDSKEKNTVAEVFQTGFQADGKVIRFAMVKVAN